jgi:hypothetical protein
MKEVIVGIITGIVSGLISGIVIYHWSIGSIRSREKKILRETSENIVNITFRVLEQYRTCLVPLSKISYSDTKVKDFNLAKTQCHSIQRPNLRNYELTLESSIKYIDEIKHLILVSSGAKLHMSVFRNESKVSNSYEDLISKLHHLYRQDVADNYVQFIEHYHKDSKAALTQFMFVKVCLNDLCKYLEYRIGLLLKIIDKKIALSRIIESSLWVMDDPINYDELCNRVNDRFNIYFTDDEFWHEMNQLIKSKSVTYENGRFSKFGFSTGLTGTIPTKM